MTRTICFITTTRADWGLLRPLAELLRHRGHTIRIIASNMHLDLAFGATASEIESDGFAIDFAVPLPGGDSAADRAAAMGICTTGIARALESIVPDAVVALGDRYEMLGAVSAAALMHIPVVHIAGGEISEGAADDSFRHAITKLSSLHLTATADYRKRVIQLGEHPDTVFDTGALGVQNLLSLRCMSREELQNDIGMSLSGDIAVVTYHPATLDTGADHATRTADMLKALDRFPELKLVITYPNNDTGGASAIPLLTEYAGNNPGRVALIPSLGATRYLSMLKIAALVIGNSSSGIVEVPSAGIPTVDIGIRQRGRTAADSVIHCNPDTDSIAHAIEKALSPAFREKAKNTSNPYSKSDTTATMAAAIEKFLENETIPRPSMNIPLYIIPARGGSKGIPHKNIAPLAGRPLIAYTIDAALEAQQQTGGYILVSTDDDNIAAAAENCGIKVGYRRPPELATDTAGSRETIIHAMDWADARGIVFDSVVLLQPTSPLRNAADIMATIKAYDNDPQADMALTVTPSDDNPYYNLFETDADGVLHICKGHGLYTRRQDVPKVFRINGAVYVIRPSSLRQMPLGEFPRRIPVEMPSERSIDIDSPDDLQRAEKRL